MHMRFLLKFIYVAFLWEWKRNPYLLNYIWKILFLFIKFLVLFFNFNSRNILLISFARYHYCVVYYGFLRVLQTIIFHIAICCFVAFCINIIITLCTLTETRTNLLHQTWDFTLCLLQQTFCVLFLRDDDSLLHISCFVCRIVSIDC